MTFWQRIIEWLTRPRLAVRLLQAEIARLRADNLRLQDILTQAWEQGRVIPRQPEHAGGVSELPSGKQYTTMGEEEVAFQIRAREEYEVFLRAERERQNRTYPKPT